MNDMSLKSHIRAMAKEKNISAQTILQNYLMQHFLYRLSKEKYDISDFTKAFVATATHRESLDKISDIEEILNTIENDKTMNSRWKRYAELSPYAKGISFSEIIDNIAKMLIMFSQKTFK